jgi:hypothetical protein
MAIVFATDEWIELVKGNPGRENYHRRSEFRRRTLKQSGLSYWFFGSSLNGVPFSGPGSLGRPRTRSPMMFFWTSLVPP